MSTSYRLFLSDGTFDQLIAPETQVDDHGLTLAGQGLIEYGEYLNHNILHLLENFANSTAPSNPLIGQMWYDSVGGTVQVWDGSVWNSFSLDDYIVQGTYSVNNGTSSLTIPRNQSSSIVVNNVATIVNLNAHINDTVDAHDASAIGFTVTGSLPYNNTQDVLEYIDNQFLAHVNDGSSAHAATAISFVNTDADVQTMIGDGGYSSIDTVQEAIDMLEDYINDRRIIVEDLRDDLETHALISGSGVKHAASAISFDDSAVNFTANDVQEAIEDIVAAVGITDGLELLQANSTTSQQINSTYTKLLFQNVSLGNTSGQYNPATSVYTAGYDQEVNIRVCVSFSIAEDEIGNVEIRRNGISVRNGAFQNQDNDDGGNYTHALSKTISVKLELNAGDTIDSWIFITPANVANVTTSGNSTTFQLEVVRIL